MARGRLSYLILVIYLYFGITNVGLSLFHFQCYFQYEFSTSMYVLIYFDVILLVIHILELTLLYVFDFISYVLRCLGAFIVAFPSSLVCMVL